MKSLVNPEFVQTSSSGGPSHKLHSPFTRLARPAFGVAVLLNCLVTQGAAGASFSNVTALVTARGHHAATLLSNGKLLVAGGETSGGFTSSATELYDPSSGTWAMTGAMNGDRDHHTATMLPNGRILVAGGYSSADGSLSSAELYDPANGTWTMTGPMTAARFFHTATLLPEGKVLV